MSKATQAAKNSSMEKMKQVSMLTNPPRISDGDKQLMQTVFGMDAPIYTALRDCFYGFELDDNQKAELKRIAPVMGILRQVLLPEITKGIAFGQNYDLWQTQDIKTSTPDSFPYFYKAKVLILEMLEKSLARVENPDLEGVSLEMKVSEDDMDSGFPFLIARNGYISYVDQQIRFLMQYGIQKELSDSEIQAMIRMNSNK